MQPLVSVIMPCYDARVTLSWSLASLLAQTYECWECIVVDDGSIDDSLELARTVDDPRIRTFRFETNRGRGTARQYALEQARGEYLAMLDADDWYYPSKLAEQVTAIEEQRNVAVVSTALAVVDRQGAMAGVRGDQARCPDAFRFFPPLQTPASLPVVFAPSMIRMHIAREVGFDPSFRAVEDADFLLRVLLRHPYGILSKIAYVYSEHSSASLGKLIASNRAVSRMLKKHTRQFPVSARVRSWMLPLKNIAYSAIYLAGAEEALIRRRSRPPLPAEFEAHEAARQTVALTFQKYFAGAALPAPATA